MKYPEDEERGAQLTKVHIWDNGTSKGTARVMLRQCIPEPLCGVGNGTCRPACAQLMGAFACFAHRRQRCY